MSSNLDENVVFLFANGTRDWKLSGLTPGEDRFEEGCPFQQIFWFPYMFLWRGREDLYKKNRVLRDGFDGVQMEGPGEDFRKGSWVIYRPHVFGCR